MSVTVVWMLHAVNVRGAGALKLPAEQGRIWSCWSKARDVVNGARPIRPASLPRGTACLTKNVMRCKYFRAVGDPMRVDRKTWKCLLGEDWCRSTSRWGTDTLREAANNQISP